MPDQNVRQPVKNFFIKKSIQIKVIAKILFIILATALLTTVTVSLVYNSKSQSGSFYYMSNDTKQDLELKNILEVILPSVIGAQLVTLLIGLGIGLFSSRKIAVPIYKFEKSITIADLRGHARLQEWNALKSQFRSRCMRISPADWQRLNDFAAQKNAEYKKFLEKVESVILSKNILLEEQLEDALVKDLRVLKKFGYDLELY